jgi:hypothetical protein
VLVPALVTWGVGYVWLRGLFGLLAAHAAGLDVDGALSQLPWTVTLLTALNSVGDVAGACLDLARPLSGRARAEHGLRALRKLPALVLFTAYGRAHWRSTWLARQSRATAVGAISRSRGELTVTRSPLEYGAVFGVTESRRGVQNRLENDLQGFTGPGDDPQHLHHGVVSRLSRWVT